MAYTPINWQTGDTITAEKLNNMEQGIVDAGNEVMIVTDSLAEDNEGEYQVLNKTWQEIHDAVFTRGVSIIYSEIVEGEYIDIIIKPLAEITYDSHIQNFPYIVVITDPESSSPTEYTTDTANGYPRTRWVV